jgi:hypothetical protein
VVQLQLAPAGFGLRGNAAVGHHQRAIGIQQQLVRVHAARTPFGDLLQRRGIAHADQALGILQVGLGGVEVAAVGAFDDMAIEEAVRLDPLPLRILGGLAGAQAHQPVAGAAAAKDHGAVAQRSHAMGARGHIQGLQHLQRPARLRTGLHDANAHLLALHPGRGQRPGGRRRPGRMGGRQRHGSHQAQALQPAAAVQRLFNPRLHPRTRC